MSDPAAVKTLVLVSDAQQAKVIADYLRVAGVPVQQHWVANSTDFSDALRRNEYDLGIIHCQPYEREIPSAVLRYPATTFIATVDRFKPGHAEHLLERGVADVVGFSHPVRLQRVMARITCEARERNQNRQLQARQSKQDRMIHTLMERSTDAVAYVHQGIHCYANDAYRALTGLGKTATPDCTPMLDLFDPEDHEDIARELRLLEHGKTENPLIQANLVSYDTTLQPVTLACCQSWYNDEQVVQIHVRRHRENVLDVTQRLSRAV